jgi:hypothetical protein
MTAELGAQWRPIETCYGMVMPHALGANRFCIYCSAHNALKRQIAAGAESAEAWAARVAPTIFREMEEINAALPLPAPTTPPDPATGPDGDET